MPAEDAELAADELWAAGATAVGEAVTGSVVTLTCDLDRCPGSLTGWPHEVSVDDGAWWDGWRPFARAVRAGPFLVRPPWIAASVEPGVVELTLDAGRSFGTGSHPSTTLALEALSTLVAEGSSVLDVGCGSGALAIGAALLGATPVVAVDVDPAAVDATTRNAAANDVGGRVDVVTTPLHELTGTFDVVVANLGSPLVLELASVLAARCRDVLVLSGLLGDRWRDVAGRYEGTGLDVVDAPERDGWRAVVLRRVTTPPPPASVAGGAALRTATPRRR